MYYKDYYYVSPTSWLVLVLTFHSLICCIKLLTSPELYVFYLWEWNSFIHSNIFLYETFMNFLDWGELCISSQNQRRDLVGEVVACTGEHISCLYIPEMCCTIPYVSYLDSIVNFRHFIYMLVNIFFLLFSHFVLLFQCIVYDGAFLSYTIPVFGFRISMCMSVYIRYVCCSHRITRKKMFSF